MTRSSILFFIVFSVIILIFTAGCINTSTNHSTNNVTNNQLSPPSNSSNKLFAPTYTPPNTRAYFPTYEVTVTPGTLKDQNIEITKNIVEFYHKTHTYTLLDMYVCAQMAQDVWNMVETQNINAIIEIGSVDQDISSIQQSDHAWVLAEVSPGEYVAMETTGGYLVCPDPGICAVNNPRYFEGWGYKSPKELQDYLKNGLCPAGQIFGNDNLCHPACGVDYYCTGNSACVDQQCIGCKTGYYLGTDLQCHINR